MSLLDLIDEHLARAASREVFGSGEIRDMLLDLRACIALELIEDPEEPPEGVCPYCWASGGDDVYPPSSWSEEHRTLHGLA
jgi:hypothetical protein